MTYYKVSENPSSSHSLQNRKVVIDFMRVTFECWSENYLQAQQVENEIRKALDGYAGTSLGVVIMSVKRLDGRDLYEPDTQPKPLHRCGADYLINFKL